MLVPRMLNICYDCRGWLFSCCPAFVFRGAIGKSSCLGSSQNVHPGITYADK